LEELVAEEGDRLKARQEIGEVWLCEVTSTVSESTKQRNVLPVELEMMTSERLADRDMDRTAPSSLPE
jgi:hypothetical protein